MSLPNVPRSSTPLTLGQKRKRCRYRSDFQRRYNLKALPRSAEYNILTACLATDPRTIAQQLSAAGRECAAALRAVKEGGLLTPKPRNPAPPLATPVPSPAMSALATAAADDTRTSEDVAEEQTLVEAALELAAQRRAQRRAGGLP